MCSSARASFLIIINLKLVVCLWNHQFYKKEKNRGCSFATLIICWQDGRLIEMSPSYHSHCLFLCSLEQPVLSACKCSFVSNIFELGLFIGRGLSRISILWGQTTTKSGGWTQNLLVGTALSVVFRGPLGEL